MTAPHALLLRIRKAAESFVMEDTNGVELADVYFEDEPTRCALVNRRSSADGKAPAQTIAEVRDVEIIVALGRKGGTFVLAYKR